MQILSVHNKYLIRGGEDESQELERRILLENGHKVDLYEEDNTRVKSLNPAQLALRTIWSTEAYQLVKQRLQNSTYNLVHIQNFFPLISPSVYYAAKEQGVPIVQSLRNYRLLCPNGLFFRNGKVCEDCLGNFIPYPGIVNACYRENMLASGSVASMLTVHRAMNTWNKMVDIYITLTEFARQKMIQGGLPAEKIVVKPNFVHPDPGIGEGRGGYALFVGRLSEEKGLDTLLAAWEKLAGKIPLKIVGDGPLSAEMIAATKRIPQIEWLGRRPMSEVYDLMGEAMFVVFPSKWYETFGRVAVEAFAKGTPVIAANIGAIAELVDSGRTGLHFRPGDADDLTANVESVLANPSRLSQMRQEARAEFETKYTAKNNYQRIMKIYEQAQAVCGEVN